MRLWSLHPAHLDRQGLTALWREGLLARAVLSGRTRGYRNHPQLERFRAQPEPLAALDAYLAAVVDEAVVRGYRYDRGKLGPVLVVPPVEVAQGQLGFEWQHLMGKLARRSPDWYAAQQASGPPRCHPCLMVVPGPVAGWERGNASAPATPGGSR
ncbi:pyrimidine dimer DNA glycosylase/endonuclease V [Lysobacter sp. GX 14042]|uniref:pyrimidine dimer DNA glycosylase/endonuclease V n=1 Tax=Lysobacter sp. GX 14042 TaxID=2907155 RepID=UPI001F226D20|nr:pyrimidine dimer DNA glycosylase/endonuclease V [Lysobacter sp. GX 14042]MCE7032994.1 pyrimidine dimer DNA glycosylase/endonuclease V [Lysobacter sp. GX 14042]